MKLKAIQMLGLTLGVLAAWKVRKTLRAGGTPGATLGDIGGLVGKGWSPKLHSATGVTQYESPEADPPKNRMPSVGDLPP
ncbi:hypothetical protein [Herbaspirillum sp. alder98]|uniref:hypothetical protein n=1 Tax=Herbaspirillum sp. alder98 TaxID=2913096 RepID=UPI001CD86037|nr:hypothetical protein [Herbaspirillum sp. alder98]MCA1323258.1 hypothetical protein [Herbaspirillum sp. alder98]